ncbi:MAG: KamA family radical SAM protein [Alphaproteobacteria bacterium]|nr:KamA family radical SAM protein [Alphaproteobacteria bacterium]
MPRDILVVQDKPPSVLATESLSAQTGGIRTGQDNIGGGVAEKSLSDFIAEVKQLSTGVPPQREQTINYSPKKEKQAAYHRFPTSERSKEFLRTFYPQATIHDWNDWKWQVRNRVRRVEVLEQMLDLTMDERKAVEKRTGNLPIAITPYYLSLFDPRNPQQPLRMTHIPVGDEFIRIKGEDPDPLGEDHDTATPGLVHRYPDRVLFLTTGFCSTYCRYCTRSRMVGETNGEYSFSIDQWEKAAQYIEAHPEIRDCLLSGGDPLSIGDDKLEWLLNRLRSIKHLEFIRIGTKIPVVMPQRITKKLASMLKKYHPLWMSIHFTHPDELTPESIEACARLADAGIPLGSQTVLLRGINDDVSTLKSLFHGLLRARVKPYYLYQCDPVSGSAHFRTPVEKGLEIMKQLRGHTTGYAIPTFVVDAPGGGGKIPLLPDYILGRAGDDLLLTNFEGGTYRYPDPQGVIGTSQSAMRDQGFSYDPEKGLYSPNVGEKA